MNLLKSFLSKAAATTLIAAATLNADAGERRFTYSYEADTTPPGIVEYEQFVTWKASKQNDSAYDQIEFRHEIEFGLTDKLQMGIYVADWRYTDGRSVSNDGARYRATAIEFIYNLTDPVTDPIGSALYGEVKVGDEVFELEGKVILQKNIGEFVFVYNAIIEAEWESKDYSDDKGVFEQTFGISYEVTPQLLVGVEALHEVEFDDWDATGPNIFYVGPNVAWRSKENFWITMTPLFQITDIEGEPEYQTRFIFGFNF